MACEGASAQAAEMVVELLLSWGAQGICQVWVGVVPQWGQTEDTGLAPPSGLGLHLPSVNSPPCGWGFKPVVLETSFLSPPTQV